jgi:hypothetical protein
MPLRKLIEATASAWRFCNADGSPPSVRPQFGVMFAGSWKRIGELPAEYTMRIKTHESSSAS